MYDQATLELSNFQDEFAVIPAKKPHHEDLIIRNPKKL